MSRLFKSALLASSTLAALAGPSVARANESAPAEESIKAQPVELTVIAYAEQRSGAVPPPLPSVPPSEAVEARAPANDAIRTYPRQADGHGIKLGGYNNSRWAEDWRIMRDPTERDDVLDRLKYVPIDGDGDAYLTLSGEVRVRTNYFSNPGLVSSEHRREDMLRLVAGADLHVGPVRFFGELVHAGIGGHNYGVPPAKSRNELLAQQAFGEISGDVGPAVLGVRYGRQEFTDGPALLVSQKDDNTVRTVFDGGRAWAQLSNARVDLFDFKLVGLGKGGIGDDETDDGTRFSGTTLGFVLADDEKRKLFLDPFVWRERKDEQRWGSMTAREIRKYYGARLWGSIDRLTIDWTVDHQAGSFDGRPINAWNFFIAQTYALRDKGPKIGIHFDYGSGDDDDSRAINTARNAHGGTIPYSYQGALTITNLLQVSPNFTVSPVKGVDVTVEYQRSWRAEESDAVYRASGTAYAGTDQLEGSHVGDAIRIQAGWKITPRLSLTGRYEYFEGGDLLDQLGYDRSHYLATWLSFRL
jgi:hypothetical protein